MAVSRVEVPPGYHSLQFKSPLFSKMGAVQPAPDLVGLAGGGMLPPPGRSEPRKTSDKGPVCLQGLYLPLLSSVPCLWSFLPFKFLLLFYQNLSGQD